MSGYSPILELGDDPHPLTPRENVSVFEPCPGCGADEPRNRCLGCRHDFAPRNRQAILDGSPIIALASGSGDHAELARLAEILMDEARGVAEMPRNEKRDEQAGYSALASVALTSLLAEIAALKYAVQNGNEHLEFWENRATEAERKLAEAVGLLSEVADEFGCTIEQYHKNGPHWTSADGEMFDVGVILDREPIIERIRTFLSKEAERG